MDEDVGAGDEAAGVRSEPHVAAQFLDAALQHRVVERGEVERPHVVAVGDQAACEMQAEEARAAGDRDPHGAER